MAAIKIEALRQHLKKEALAPLYLIHGEEDLLRLEALDLLRQTAAQQGYLNRETHVVDTGFDWQSFLAEANSPSLFSDYKLLEIHIPNGKPGKAGSEALATLAQALPADTVMIVWLPKLEKAQTQAKWFSALSSAGHTIEARPIHDDALPAWISHRLHDEGLAIEDEALHLFVERVEGNLLAARQEIEKLTLLYPPPHTIALHEAEQAIANVARFDALQLSAAWFRGERERLLRLLEGLEAEGEEPLRLLALVAEDIRMLMRLTAALKQGQTIAQVRNSLRLWGDKQTNAPIAVRRIGINRLLDALNECARIDRIVKGAEDGNAWQHMRSLLLQLAS